MILFFYNVKIQFHRQKLFKQLKHFSSFCCTRQVEKLLLAKALYLINKFNVQRNSLILFMPFFSSSSSSFIIVYYHIEIFFRYILIPWGIVGSRTKLTLSLFLFVLRMTNLICKHNFPQKYTTSGFNNLTTKESIETA